MYLKSRTRSTWFHNIIVDFQDRHHFDKRISEAACEILVLLKYLLENSAELYGGIPFPFVLTELVIFLKSAQVGEITRYGRFVVVDSFPDVIDLSQSKLVASSRHRNILQLVREKPVLTRSRGNLVPIAIPQTKFS